MNKFESKYYNTSIYMNEALLLLLKEKDFEQITIKELCHKAGVNRSTFYLHYDNMIELLDETIEYTNNKFLSYYEENDYINNINNYSKEELIFITPKYLYPYLQFIKENYIIHQLAIKHFKVMKTSEKYSMLAKHIFYPIFKKYGVEEDRFPYIMSFYMNGVNGIINEWIKNNCEKDIDEMTKIIIGCIRPYENSSNN